MKPQKSLIRAGREPRRDLLLASILVLLTLLCGLGHLSNTCYWGDDFAAYISEAIAIADGNLDAQLELNSSMHPSYLPPVSAGGAAMLCMGISIAAGRGL